VTAFCGDFAMGSGQTECPNVPPELWVVALRDAE